eukprot:gene12186-biopygen21458
MEFHFALAKRFWWANLFRISRRGDAPVIRLPLYRHRNLADRPRTGLAVRLWVIVFAGGYHTFERCQSVECPSFCGNMCSLNSTESLVFVGFRGIPRKLHESWGCLNRPGHHKTGRGAVDISQRFVGDRGDPTKMWEPRCFPCKSPQNILWGSKGMTCLHLGKAMRTVAAASDAAADPASPPQLLPSLSMEGLGRGQLSTSGTSEPGRHRRTLPGIPANPRERCFAGAGQLVFTAVWTWIEHPLGQT